ncbi:hypothetical protein LTR84_008581 [Exophiala bonariae]|uniref:Xylanolytic transcriptional activator regulatory domain-containing protein n=1 Tax=Exophiala bonariae TaxID=1690606 RepID=A0AAV9MX12_9EURO|nr:hypothetical protein LTR84_008581 [Exophiala bonariae]
MSTRDTSSLLQPMLSSEPSDPLVHASKSKDVSHCDERNITVSDEEARIDTLATGTFSDEIETDIGHFGPSSNHDYFRNLSGIFAHLARDGFTTQSSALNTWSVPRNLIAGVPERRSHISGIFDCMALPDDQTALALLKQFFTTIALTMPFFNRPALVRGYTKLKERRFQDFDRVQRALFNMIWAHGSCSLGAVDSEVYYRRAISLLDSLTIRRTSQEMVQTCLLVTSYQQNNQRSVTSWTFHALSVKAAFQLGLHSQSSYQSLNAESQQLRKRLWFGVLNQDRLLSAALGRPCLIPKQHARIEPDDPRPTTIYLDAVSPDRIESWTYFRHVISIISIISRAVEVLYDHNIDSAKSSIDNLLVRRLELQLELERWRISTAGSWKLLTGAELHGKPKSTYESLRFEILLSIHYYRTLMLINRPLITSILKSWITELSLVPETTTAVVLPIVQNDFTAAKELVGIVQAIESSGTSFLHRYGAWFLANYSVFTASIHLFGIMLACARHPDRLSISNIHLVDVRGFLNDGLLTLQAIGKASLMSQRGSNCFFNFLDLFDSLVRSKSPDMDEQDISPCGPTRGNAESALEFAMGSMSSYIVQAADDFLFQSSENDFLWDNYGYVS